MKDLGFRVYGGLSFFKGDLVLDTNEGFMVDSGSRLGFRVYGGFGAKVLGVRRPGA